MGIYARVRHLALVAICASGLVAGIGMAAAPGSALAAVKCALITGSGSSLQTEQQEKWTGFINPETLLFATKGEDCTNFPDKVLYTATSSGQGLEEFALQAIGGVFEINKTKSGNKTSLDGFIGTDDPPLETAVKESAKVAGTTPLTVPIVAAPIAIIVHPPVGCLNLSYPLTIPNTELSSVFSKTLTWEKVLLASGATFDNIGGACNANVLVEVRSDESGTSFGLKQYLCQVDPKTWGNVTAPAECQSGKEFVSDAATWPAAAKVDTTHVEGGKTVENSKSKGEAEAVKLTEGSIGYVNLANGVQAGALSTTIMEMLGGQTLAQLHLFFIADVQIGVDPAVLSAGLFQGNCPTSYNYESSATIKAEAKKGLWGLVHLAKPTQSGAYPLCTFTYDVGWENYKTTKLEEAANYNGKGTEVGATAKGYFEYMTSTVNIGGMLGGQKDIADYYAPLPSTGEENVQELASKLAKEKIG
jgi:ABC-type phosphate transport system substrate-binding protein